MTQDKVKGPKSLLKWGKGWSSEILCLWNFSCEVRESREAAEVAEVRQMHRERQ